RLGPYLVEHGPNSIQARTKLLEDLVAELGLEAELVEASPAAKQRFVVRGGRPAALPTSPPAFLASPLFSAAAQVGLLREPSGGGWGTSGWTTPSTRSWPASTRATPSAWRCGTRSPACSRSNRRTARSSEGRSGSRASRSGWWSRRRAGGCSRSTKGSRRS